MIKIRPKERKAILDSLRAGVVPKVGLRHIHVGRAPEIAALVGDMETIADGGAAFRLLIGRYGSGKSFLINLIAAVAMEKKLVAARADLSPERRLHATGGQARGLYAELMKGLSTRSKPEGGALPSVMERFITSAMQSARDEGREVEAVIRERMARLEEMTGGYDFARVIEAYYRGHEQGDETLQRAALRWLRGEYTTRTEARKALDVRTVISDETVYDHLKLVATLCRLAGFSGLLICLDEMVNLYKIANSQSRNANYEQLLRMINDCLQGSVEGLGFVLGGTPEFLSDPRRGLYSYEALQSRLAENRFAREGLVDYSGPVIRLDNLSREDLYLLLQKIRDIVAVGGAEMPGDEAIEAFLDHCFRQVGAAYFKTPRNSIKEWVSLLSVLEQNPGADWQALIGSVSVEREGAVPTSDDDSASGSDDGDDLAEFRL